MTREQAKEILNGMPLEDCIKMWNECGADMYMRSAEIHEMDDERWWDYLAKELGTYYLVWHIHYNNEFFDIYDEYFFYNDGNSTFISFTTKEDLLEEIEDWFIEELINREN